MRLASPAPGTLWRERASTDDRSRPFTIDGHVILEGTIFGVTYTVSTMMSDTSRIPSASCRRGG
ncbi:hypothetical protein GGS24DRAFT_227124 [Hypoxylon argillaceum]|nr:hypothetical protein GGS24DRAFT_227124 [Hypoxylon argillaceum]